MKTVHEVSKLAGVSIRTLHHYDAIGLLPATEVRENGYRFYDDKALERLQQILLFKELEFPLREIKRILDNPHFDKNEALTQQIHLLTLRQKHLQGLIDLACEIKEKGAFSMKFEAFNTEEIEKYAVQAKEIWGQTREYQQYEKKSQSRTKDREKTLGDELMDIMASFGEIKEHSPESREALSLVEKLQHFITENYYECGDEMLQNLGAMYTAGGKMTENIDKAGGIGTAAFIQAAIQAKVNR